MKTDFLMAVRCSRRFPLDFIAQELEEVQENLHAEWLNLVLKDNPDRLEATQGNLIPVLVKAIQEQQKQIEDLKKEIFVLKSK